MRSPVADLTMPARELLLLCGFLLAQGRLAGAFAGLGFSMILCLDLVFIHQIAMIEQLAIQFLGVQVKLDVRQLAASVMDLRERLFQDLAIYGSQLAVVQAVCFEISGDLGVAGIPGV